MAKDFAKRFYHTQAWLDCSEAYRRLRFRICEKCGEPGNIVHHKILLTEQNINDPNITLNFDNLELLCKHCHDREEGHFLDAKKNNNKKKANVTAAGVMFDEYGNLVQSKDVTIVYGSPGAGKTSYVIEHMKDGDLVIDLDKLLEAISFKDIYQGSEGLKPYVYAMRDTLYDSLERRIGNINKAWVVACLPNKREREYLARRLRAELVHIDTDQEQCISRAMLDNRRENKYLQKKIIENYFKEYED